MLTDLEKIRIQKALEVANGNRTIAAVALGYTPVQLKDKIHSSPELKLRWTRSRAATQAPTAVEKAINAPSIPINALIVPVEPIKTPEQIESEFADGIEKIPTGILTNTEKDYAKSVHTFQLRHHAKAFDTINGSAGTMAVKLAAAAGKLIDRLNSLMDDGCGPVKGIGGEASESAVILSEVPKLAAEVRKLAEMVTGHNLAKQELEMKRIQASQPKARGKPGFKPLVAIQANAGATVRVSDGSDD